MLLMENSGDKQNFVALGFGSEYSMQLNASRIKVLQAQDDVINSMKEAAEKDLLNVSQDHHLYRQLLKDLIVQVSEYELIYCCFISYMPIALKL